MPVSVTPAREEHVPVILELLEVGLREQEGFAAACDPPEDPGFFVAEMTEHRDALESRRDGWSVALDETGRVVGVVRVRFDSGRLGRYGSVRQIVVATGHRRRGVATRLLGHAEAVVRRSDARFLLISALRPNPAWMLYRSLGFTDLPDELREDRNPEHVVLWKWLGEPERPPKPGERGAPAGTLDSRAR